MKSYRIHEFAHLAGVTVKALHHYDRLGLLTPRRSETGYRVYRECDLERLEQIVALKFLGLPLKQIRAVLERTKLALPLRWYMEGLAMMNTERFDRAADFLDDACRAGVPQ